MLMRLRRSSPCKVNFLLNILGKRADGFHELETLFFPVPLHDEIVAEAAPEGISLTCSNPTLPCDGAPWLACWPLGGACCLNS